ncbi:acyl-[acyl-carrier-protein] thioesterase [Peptoniphilus catoniae]|uniref:acyl-[acyl-carrier-protein] thioesterase n=1 Tax=Peptoniphilus catoniae TaxID=1660341 RepID=UPI0010FD746E|nr:acyl-ACP thioesterase domain-containing protein [Peptoniphilus catoniae]
MFTKDFKVYKSLCDNGSLTLYNLLKLLLKTSNEEYEREGKSYFDFIKDYNCIWIIYRWRLEQIRPIERDEFIKIKTWTSKFRKIYCYREYRVFDSSGNLLVKATALFLLLDLKNKKPVIIGKDMINKYKVFPKKNFDNFLYLESDNDIKVVKEFTVKNSDIDYNGHVNNTIYVYWIYKSIDENFLEGKYINYFDIVYKREIKNDKKIYILSNDNFSYLEVCTNETNAKINIKYKKS